MLKSTLPTGTNFIPRLFSNSLGSAAVLGSSGGAAGFDSGALTGSAGGAGAGSLTLAISAAFTGSAGFTTGSTGFTGTTGSLSTGVSFGAAAVVGIFLSASS